MCYRRSICIESKRVRSNLNLLCRAADIEMQIGANGLIHLKRDVVLYRGLESSVLRGDGVVPRQQKRSREVTGSIGGQCPDFAGAQVSDRDLRSGNHSSGGVGEAASDAAGCILTKHGARDSGACAEQEQRIRIFDFIEDLRRTKRIDFSISPILGGLADVRSREG